MSKILVIEDEASVRIPLVDLLRIEGFEVIEAADGEAGVTIAEEEKPDLILCDIVLPVKDGFEVLEILRNNDRLILTPFIFLTGRNESGDRERGFSLGADDFVATPFDAAVLVKRIRSLLERFRIISESLDQVRMNLVGKVPHEFKTPLNGILGFAAMMKENALILNPSEVRDFSALILQSGERMLQTVINYVRYLELQIDFNREQLSDKQASARYKIEPKSLRPLLEKLYSRYSRRKGDITLFLLPATLAVSDEDFSFMLYQLLDNALKFSRSNTRINLNTIVDEPFYVIAIEDRGHGMRREQISSLGPFIQLNREEQEQQGLGLGLSIVQKLCSIYGGTLSINSHPGEGTRVILRLPIAEE
ncbi:MAG: response regulator [Verrucomicrobia bacterium]|nr:response regulator [Verrucomicrobiota bacterium]MDA1065398.1 response regulator [Verrucomicrobiota bacterium]